MDVTARPWWQQATALVTLGASGAITGLQFVPKPVADMASPTASQIRLLAQQQPARPARPAAADDQALRAAIVKAARYYLRMATEKTPAQMEAIIWQRDSLDGADHGPTCAAFASLALELGARAVGRRSWVTGGSTYPWPVHSWVDARVDLNPVSPNIISIVQDAQTHHRWHPIGDGYRPLPGDWVLFNGHVEVVTGYSGGTLSSIGASSLPNLTVNAHEIGGSLAADGVVGFVDNGGLPAGPAGHVHGAGGHDAARPGAGGRASGPPAQGAPAQGPQAQGRPAQGPPATATAVAAGVLDGARQAGGAAIPGLPSAGSRPAATSPAATSPAATSPAATSASRAGGPASPEIPGFPLRSRRRPARPGGPAPAAYRRHPLPTAAGPAVAGSPQATTSQQAFINEVAPGAIAAQRRYGVPASVTVAQAIEESGWGQSSLAAQDHNLFGIKGAGPAGSVQLPTQEYENGQWVTIVASFRAYQNFAQSIEDHGQLLATSGYYGAAMAQRHNPDAFANALTGVYATDPNYGTTLIGLMQRYNLYRYDAAAPAAAARPARPAAPAPRPDHPSGPPPTSRGAAGPAGTAARRLAGRGAAAIPGLPPAAAPAPSPEPAPGRPAGPAPAGHASAPLAVPRGTAPPPASRTSASAAGPRPGPPGRPGPARPGAARGRRPSRGSTMARYRPQLPQAVRTAFATTARSPLLLAQPLYRDVAGNGGIDWRLLAACDWMQCEANPRYSPVHGERLGAISPDGARYRTRSAALEQCAADLLRLSWDIYHIDPAAGGWLSVLDLARVFAAFRWGGLLRLHRTSALEFPYSVAGLTARHANMRWPDIADPNAPDKPGTRFRLPFGAVPVMLSLGYPALA